MADLKEAIKRFLEVPHDDGYGKGSSCGDGFGDGCGFGDGFGFGDDMATVATPATAT